MKELTKKTENVSSGLQDMLLKPMKCELNFLSKSDGSAFLSQGDTVVIASVNGPLDVKQQNQNIEKTTFEVQYMPKSGRTTVIDRYRENIIRQTCEVAVLKKLHPRTAVTVNVQELENYGGLIACCLNAICLALLNSGLPMMYTFAAVWCIVDEVGNIVVDPPATFCEGATATMTFVFDGVDLSLVDSITQGKFSDGHFREARDKCKTAVAPIFEFYRDITRKYSKCL